MCGICGFINSDKNEYYSNRAKVLDNMMEVQKHRGPDEKGTFFDESAAIGQTRLSIIDLKTGRQPMSNENNTIWLVFNGEIYNFIELREILIKQGHVFKSKTDSEVIIHLYEEYGDDFIVKLNGMFAFAIWDTSLKKLILGRDRFGIKPLHYYYKDGFIAFASEIKSLLKLPNFNREIDIDALNLYLTYEYVPSPKSIYKDIFKLESGHILEYAHSSFKKKPFWQFNRIKQNISLRKNDQVEKLIYLLDKSVKLRLVSDVPVGVLLSGGIDSSAILYFMRKYFTDNLKTFSVRFHDRTFDESKYIDHVNSYYGIENYSGYFGPSEFIDTLSFLSHLIDEPLGDASLLPTFYLSKLTRETVKVALGGDGSDELFAGYPTYKAHKFITYYNKIPSFIHNYIISNVANALPVSDNNFSFDFCLKSFLKGYRLETATRHINWMGSFDLQNKDLLLSEELKQELVMRNCEIPIRSYLQSQKNVSNISKMQMVDFCLYLQDDILAKTDRASMLASLEVRVPFLDNDLVDYVCSLPENMKLRGLKEKYILKKALKGKLPNSILNRSKKGFGIPLSSWIKTDIKDLILDELSSSKLIFDGYINGKTVNKIISDHIQNKVDNRKKIYTLLALSLWYNNFFCRS